MLHDLKKSRARRHLSDPAYGFLFEDDDSGSVTVLAGTTDSFEPANAQLTGLAAVRIVGKRMYLSQGLFLNDLAGAVPPHDLATALPALLTLMGGRPLVGYYLSFLLEILDRSVRALIGTELPQTRIDVSALYYEQKSRNFTKEAVDLRFGSILADLGLPERGPATPRNEAISIGMIYLKLHAAP
ncbi:MAG: DNA polymerase III [Azospirillaceae bacterium]|nr:DNA polymerase III [Azospirillaceae bacterium]